MNKHRLRILNSGKYNLNVGTKIGVQRGYGAPAGIILDVPK